MANVTTAEVLSINFPSTSVRLDLQNKVRTSRAGEFVFASSDYVRITSLVLRSTCVYDELDDAHRHSLSFLTENRDDRSSGGGGLGRALAWQMEMFFYESRGDFSAQAFGEPLQVDRASAPYTFPGEITPYEFEFASSATVSLPEDSGQITLYFTPLPWHEVYAQRRAADVWPKYGTEPIGGEADR